LKHRLTGEAKDAWKRLPEEQQFPYAVLIGNLTKSLVNQSPAAEMAKRAKFNMMMQESEQSVRQFVTRLDLQARQAYPPSDYGGGEVARIKMDRLLVGLKLNDMQLKLIYAIKDKEEGHEERYQRLAEMALNMEETRNGISNMQHLLQVNQQVREPRVKGNPFAAFVGPGRLMNEKWMSLQECYSCHGKGHFSRDCSRRSGNYRSSNEAVNKKAEEQNNFELPWIKSIQVDACHKGGEDGLVNKESKQDFRQSAVRRC
jgi:hypothetical protein